MDFNLTLIGQSIAMIVFVWFCMKFIWPPLMSALDERAATIAEGLAAGEQAEKDLAQAKASADELIAEAKSQALEIVDQANKRANAIVDEGREDGKREKDRQIESAQSEIESQINQARDELRAKVSQVAVAGAEKILQREIDASAHKNLLDSLAAEI